MQNDGKKIQLKSQPYSYFTSHKIHELKGKKKEKENEKESDKVH